jgi:adenylate kinase
MAAEEGIPQISTGEILREAIKEKTLLGRQAKEFIESGKLVPDEIVIGVIRDKLSGLKGEEGFILDGFPRTVAQAEALDRMLPARGQEITRAINFEVPSEEVIRRLSGRRTCSGCQAVYHLEYATPREAGRCDKCGQPLIQRKDDEPETIANRLKVYRERTSPLIAYYQKRGILQELDATGPIDQVYERLRQAVSVRR